MMNLDISLMKQIAAAYKQTKLASKQHGRNSQQYQDALAYHASLLVKHMTGKVISNSY